MTARSVNARNWARPPCASICRTTAAASAFLGDFAGALSFSLVPMISSSVLPMGSVAGHGTSIGSQPTIFRLGPVLPKRRIGRSTRSSCVVPATPFPQIDQSARPRGSNGRRPRSGTMEPFRIFEMKHCGGRRPGHHAHNRGTTEEAHSRRQPGEGWERFLLPSTKSQILPLGIRRHWSPAGLRTASRVNPNPSLVAWRRSGSPRPDLDTRMGLDLVAASE